MIKLRWLAAFVLTLTMAALAGENAPDLILLQTLRPSHPRLLVLDEELAAVKELIKTDPAVKVYISNCRLRRKNS